MYAVNANIPDNNLWFIFEDDDTYVFDYHAPPDVDTEAEALAMYPSVMASVALSILPTADELRRAALLALPDVVALRTTLLTLDGPGIDAWCAANANSLPELRDAFKALVKLLAIALR